MSDLAELKTPEDFAREHAREDLRDRRRARLHRSMWATAGAVALVGHGGLWDLLSRLASG